jgi:hypothetical protein
MPFPITLSCKYKGCNITAETTSTLQKSFTEIHTKAPKGWKITTVYKLPRLQDSNEEFDRKVKCLCPKHAKE